MNCATFFCLEQVDGHEAVEGIFDAIGECPKTILGNRADESTLPCTCCLGRCGTQSVHKAVHTGGQFGRAGSDEAAHDGYLAWPTWHRIHPQVVARSQGYLCPVCGESLFNDEELHLHHLVPRSHGGTNDRSNLRLVHLYCHQQIHGTASACRQ